MSETSERKNRLRIAVDIDHVLADLSSLVIPLISEVLNRRIELADIEHYDIAEALSLEGEVAKRIWHEVYERQLYDRFPPVPGAIDALREWCDDDVWVVTSRPRDLESSTARWLNDHGFKYNRLIFVDGLLKAESDHLIDVLIDDHPDVILAAASNVPNILLLDYPWNRAFTLPPNCTRVVDWMEVRHRVDCIRRSEPSSR